MKYRRWLRLAAHTRDEIARDVDEELEAHVSMRAEALKQAGATEEQARRAALQRFSDYPRTRDALIDAARLRHDRKRRMELVDGVRQDIGYALRRLRKEPSYAAFSILLLAGAIGLTTAAFSALSGVLLKALPFDDSERLYELQSVDSLAQPVGVVSMANWVDWKEQSSTLEASAIHRRLRSAVLVNGSSSRAAVTITTGDFFRVLRTPLQVGRAYTDADAENRAVVVSSAFHASALGSRHLPIEVIVDGARVNVVGVVRNGFEYPKETQIWMVQPYRAGVGSARNSVNYQAIARLRQNASVERATDDLGRIAKRIRESDRAALYSYGVQLVPLRDQIVGDAADYLPIFTAAVGLVLLIACANLAGLNAARSSTRLREMAVRASVGAGRGRLLRQLLIEHLVIALIGGTGGVALAAWALKVTATRAAGILPRADEIGLNLPVLLFALGVSILAGVVTGLLPALRLSSNSIAQQTRVRAVHGGRQLPGRTLVIVEAAVAVVLLTSGLLLVRSYRAVLSRDPGFDVGRLVAADIVLAPSNYPGSAERLRYWDRLLAEVRGQPDIRAAAVANWIPFTYGGKTFIEVEGKSGSMASAGYRAVGDDYFNALGLPLLAGRGIEPADDSTRPRVAVINRAMARKLWPDSNPIGKRLRAPGMETTVATPTPPWLTIVGVVGDLRHFGLEQDPEPELYVSYRQVADPHAVSMSVVARARTNNDQAIRELRNSISVIDPQTPADIQQLEERLGMTLRTRQMTTALLTTFAAFAILLAALGLYSLLAFAVAQRGREIALRLALGADVQALVRGVFANAMAIVAIGGAAGLLVAAGLTRFLSGMLVQVRPLDPITIALTITTLAAAAAIAALLPARRAARISPLEALKAE